MGGIVGIKGVLRGSNQYLCRRAKGISGGQGTLQGVWETGWVQAGVMSGSQKAYQGVSSKTGTMIYLQKLCM